MSDAAALKDQGNKAFAAKDYTKAIDLFSQAIELDKSNHVLYSNRSAAKAGLKDWAGALQDAEECVKINPKWAKGYARKGAALHGSRRYDEAITAYEAGIAIEDSPALQKGLKEVKDAKDADEAADPGGLLKQFADPNLIGKLAANPKTKPLLDDPSFVAKAMGLVSIGGFLGIGTSPTEPMFISKLYNFHHNFAPRPFVRVSKSYAGLTGGVVAVLRHICGLSYFGNTGDLGRREPNLELGMFASRRSTFIHFLPLELLLNTLKKIIDEISFFYFLHYDRFFERNRS
ncbi:Hsp90 cochaperone [Tulasnella sp. UAMH 9824]|nr:Hsp90 cochaperone [Tulasnella sp. UAMH 9824]